MTENEAIEELKKDKDMIMTDLGIPEEIITEFEIAITALEEIQQYRAIGTVEECREARERQKPKKPGIWGDGYDDKGNIIYDMYVCPNCDKGYEVDYDNYKFCPECGQAIDRRDLDKLSEWV